MILSSLSISYLQGKKTQPEKLTGKRNQIIETLKMSFSNIQKGEIVQLPNEHNHKIIRVISGILRMYVVDDKGKEHIYMFAPEGWTLSDFMAIADSKASIFFIDAIENSKIEIITKGINEKLPNTFDEHTSQTIDLMGRRIATLQNRVVMLLSYSALDRYKQFLSTYPDIVNRVPQKMIASYLGITPQALSKIRGKKINNK
jgi:CRP-like cAMP-binding protein